MSFDVAINGDQILATFYANKHTDPRLPVLSGTFNWSDTQDRHFSELLIVHYATDFNRMNSKCLLRFGILCKSLQFKTRRSKMGPHGDLVPMARLI